MGLRALALGTAAGGGLPQWNCGCAACRRSRAGDPQVPPRTQTSLAVSADGAAWFLLNASPDIGRQIAHTPALQPRGAGRDSPIAGVVLTGAEIDAVAGLLTLRERHPFGIFATAGVLAALAANPIFDALDAALVARRPIAPGVSFSPASADGSTSGLTIEAFAVPGKAPLYLEARFGARAGVSDDDYAIGLRIRAAGSTGALAFAPSCARITPAVERALDGAALVMFDGTLWRDDEMGAIGRASRSGAQMGHVSMAGADGAIAGLRDVRIGRRVFTHLNHTNPTLLPDAPERAEARAAGWEIAVDGVEYAL